jgi:hypothetical protein
LRETKKKILNSDFLFKNMEKGQSSTEYILLLGAAMLAVALVGVVAYVVISNPRETTFPVNEDKTGCVIGNNSYITIKNRVTKKDENVSLSVLGYSNVNLLGYEKPYGGTQETAPQSIEWKGTACYVSSSPPSPGSYQVCKLQKKYGLSFNKTELKFMLEKESGWPIVYECQSGTASGTSTQTKEIYASNMQYWTFGGTAPGDWWRARTTGDSYGELDFGTLSTNIEISDIDAAYVCAYRHPDSEVPGGDEDDYIEGKTVPGAHFNSGSPYSCIEIEVSALPDSNGDGKVDGAFNDVLWKRSDTQFTQWWGMEAGKEPYLQIVY